MTRYWGWALVLALMVTGCASKNFLVSSGDYRARVRTLGVLPLLMDTGSTILHPERDAVVQIIRENNRDKSAYLVQRLKEKKDYFDVRAIDGNAEELFSSLIRGSTPAVKKDSFYRGYHFNTAQVAELCRQHMVDGLLIVTLGGATVPRTQWDRTHLNYLTAQYNMILESAAVIAKDGKLLWEYNGSPDAPFLSLQYPDFDEAHYNKVDSVRLKFVSLDGVKRALQQTSSTVLTKDFFPEAYGNLLNGVTGHMRLGW